MEERRDRWASRTISIVDTNVTVTPGADKIKLKNLLAHLLRLVKEHSKGVARKVENLIQSFNEGKFKLEVFTSLLQQELGPNRPDLDPFLKEFRLQLQKMEVQVNSGV